MYGLSRDYLTNQDLIDCPINQDMLYSTTSHMLTNSPTNQDLTKNSPTNQCLTCYPTTINVLWIGFHDKNYAIKGMITKFTIPNFDFHQTNIKRAYSFQISYAPILGIQQRHNQYATIFLPRVTS
jgi:hypothetical protein